MLFCLLNSFRLAAGGNYVIPLVLCIFIAGVLFVSVFFQSVIYFLLAPFLRSSPSLVERSTTVEYFYVILSFFFFSIKLWKLKSS